MCRGEKETSHTWQERQHTRLRLESPSSYPLPFFIWLLTSNNKYLFASKAGYASQSQKAGNKGKEAGGETTLAAACEWITNRVDSLRRNVPVCLVSWPASRCFPATARIVCCCETTVNAAVCCCWGELGTYTSVNSFRLVAGLKTSRRPITCKKYENHCGVNNPKNNRQQLNHNFKWIGNIISKHIMRHCISEHKQHCFSMTVHHQTE